jgi:4-hydroxybenzoate polyprenyltransferase
MKDDFIKILFVFLLCTIVIVVIIPLNVYFFVTGGVLLVIAISLQLFWNKYFKED